ncbi:zinc finger protein on ecdysone puffs isoform X2 [Episyrphus balteatus]|uniref:zinc finger protein on ecdysone puffs isoform X2 n=1 Tax=Episyrphus balteatus TaxID=286459 RepID=UPI0024858865|nr:zinc finger protein on ecdysone puffs isoform X2 [Episyrphus balteatus]
MAPSVKMAFRGNNNRNRNFGGNYGGGPMAGGNNRMGMNMSPWDNQNAGGGNYGGGNMRQGGGGGVGGGQGMNAQAISLANNLLNNLFRNQNPPSLLDLPRGGGGMAGNRNQRPGPPSQGIPLRQCTQRHVLLSSLQEAHVGCQLV